MRKAKAEKRQILEDPVYKNRLVAKFINRSMRDGKKSVAQRHVYVALEKVGESVSEDVLKVFLQAIENVKPEMEVRARRVGGAAYQVPVPVRGDRREALAIRWVVKAASERPSSEYRTYAEKLAVEIVEAYKGEGGAVKQKQTMEKMAESNRAFAHFKW